MNMEKEKDFKVGDILAASPVLGEIIEKKEVTQAAKECSDDDDCYEIDPVDFTLKLSHEVSNNEEGNEVVLVAAKGPVALRDFPHPRHLCGNLPFKNTPHEKHCKQCYCIVCEVPAPCFQWNNGIDEHCHASERHKRNRGYCSQYIF